MMMWKLADWRLKPSCKIEGLWFVFLPLTGWHVGTVKMVLIKWAVLLVGKIVAFGAKAKWEEPCSITTWQHRSKNTPQARCFQGPFLPARHSKWSIFQVHIVLQHMKFKNSGWSNVRLSNVWHKRSFKLRFFCFCLLPSFIWVKQSICSKEYVVRIKVFWSNNTFFFTRLLKPIFSYTPDP